MTCGIPPRKYQVQNVLLQELDFGAFIESCKLWASIGVMITVAPLVLTMIYVIFATNYKTAPSSRIVVTAPVIRQGGVIDEGYVINDNKHYAPVIREDYK